MADVDELTEMDMAEAMGESSTLSQEEIDNLLGFDASSSGPSVGIPALLENSQESYQRLPVLDVVFDRYARALSTTIRNFTGENADVNIETINSVRFEDYLNSVPLPALLSIFQAVEWENYGLITIDSSLTYTMVDILLGGGRVHRPVRIEGRAFTGIEQGIVKELSKLMLQDLCAAFNPLTPTTLRFERLETNPRFASIARPAAPVIFVSLRVDLDNRTGKAEVLFPYATLEPINDLLTQMFDGESFGSDGLWEANLNNEIQSTNLQLEACFNTKPMTLGDLAALDVGQTILLDNRPDDELSIRCQGIQVMKGTIGSSNDKMAMKISEVHHSQVKSFL